MHLREDTVSSELIFDGKVVKLYKDEARLEDGSVVSRELIKHPGGVCVVPIDQEGNVYLVKQFRYPFKTQLIEIPAGKLEYGEDPEQCGLRELKEEAGAECDRFDYLGKLYPTVAYDSEIIYMYLARDLSFGERDLDDDEFLDVFKVPFEKAVEMVMSGEILDSKTQLAILKAKMMIESEKK
ncbi:MAG: NUDIX hydrolase [Ruminococcus sp.]|nr:NUDIX hydrolase [Ruminococcus sp.]